MPALGMLASWAGYAVGLWGYCLVRGYNVTLMDLVNPVHPYRGKWPPPTNIPRDTVFPNGQKAGAEETAAAPAAAGQADTGAVSLA